MYTWNHDGTYFRLLVRLESVEAADLLSTRMEDTSTAEVVGIDVDAVEVTPAEAVELDARTDRSMGLPRESCTVPSDGIPRGSSRAWQGRSFGILDSA